MATDDTTRSPIKAPPVRFRRLAEQVADELRQRILLGDLGDGAELPIEDELRSQYPVSKPTLREAMRVLEAEGLITVRRGSVGGSVIHRPNAENVAYSLGLVLASRGTDIDDVGTALQEVEPACAAACAVRGDRHEQVVPTLEQLYAESVDRVDDIRAVTASSRQFHEAIVDLSGNQSLMVMAGALESIWSVHESSWAHSEVEADKIPRSERLEALAEHQELIELIANGDAEAARRHAQQHLLTSQSYPKGDGESLVIDPHAIRVAFVTRTFPD